jgi:hypothetical protein
VNVCEGCLQRLWRSLNGAECASHVDLWCAVSLRRLYCFTLLLVWAFPGLISFRKESSKSILALKQKAAWVVKYAAFQSICNLVRPCRRNRSVNHFVYNTPRLLIRTIILPCTSSGSVVRGRYCTYNVYTLSNTVPTGMLPAPHCKVG